MINKKYTMSNGYEIPAIGFGTFRTKSGEETLTSVMAAIESGYRHIDCAAIYDNEKSVGEAIKKSGINREELFVTSKLWNSEKGYEETKRAFQKTLDDLQLDYLDLYLIHWPVVKDFRDNWQEANAETWRAFEDLYNEGKIKSIGVSNFLQPHLEELFKTAKMKPMVNQIEIHPGHLQQDTVDFCKENGIVVEAWAPFANGDVFKNEMLGELAEKYGKTKAQVVLQWLVQKEILPLPKSITVERIQSNLAIGDFEITGEDMEKIDAIDNCVGSGVDPNNIDF